MGEGPPRGLQSYAPEHCIRFGSHSSRCFISCIPLIIDRVAYVLKKGALALLTRILIYLSSSTSASELSAPALQHPPADWCRVQAFHAAGEAVTEGFLILEEHKAVSRTMMALLISALVLPGWLRAQLGQNTRNFGYVGNFLEGLCVSNARKFEARTGPPAPCSRRGAARCATLRAALPRAASHATPSTTAPRLRRPCAGRGLALP